MKRITFALVLIVALAATLLTGCLGAADDPTEMLKNDAASVFTIDVNPGIRVYISSEDKVIGVEATNEDGESVIAELDVEGEELEAAVEVIVDEMFAQGFITDENNSVLLSIEKSKNEFFDKVNAKINATFEKHGKEACVIEQKLDELEDEIANKLEELSKKHDISEGKAHLIERIREEFPELTEEELAALNVRDLYLILDGASEEVKGHFKKHGEMLENLYIGTENAVSAALADFEDVELTVDSVEHLRVHLSRDDGKMIYEVEFVYDGYEYEFEIDAESGAVIEKEQEKWEELDIKSELRDFYDKHKEHIDEFFKDGKLDIDIVFGDSSNKGDESESKPIKISELIDKVLEHFDIAEAELEKTSFKTVEEDGNAVVVISVETKNGEQYKAYIEAYTGLFIKATLNGEALDITVE